MSTRTTTLGHDSPANHSTHDVGVQLAAWALLALTAVAAVLVASWAFTAGGLVTLFATFALVMGVALWSMHALVLGVVAAMEFHDGQR